MHHRLLAIAVILCSLYAPLHCFSIDPREIGESVLLQAHNTNTSGAAGTTKEFKVVGPITQHFQDWLKANGYTDDFVRADHATTQGSYGGKTSDDQKVTRTPVIFIHGNSDAALRQGFKYGDMIGFENSIDYFLKQGYTSAELYATSWGDTNPMKANYRTHDCAEVQRLRNFLEAVIKYTGAEQVSFVTHSMGVTLGRKIILGGKIDAKDGKCDIGVPIRVVDVFVGISGANYGLCNCGGVETTMAPTCNKQDGFWAGDSCGKNKQCGRKTLEYPCDGPTAYSQYLTDLNADMQQLAKTVVSSYSDADDLIMHGTITWGKSTSIIPRTTETKEYKTYTHMETKELTYEDQYNWVNRIK